MFYSSCPQKSTSTAPWVWHVIQGAKTCSVDGDLAFQGFPAAKASHKTALIAILLKSVSMRYFSNLFKLTTRKTIIWCLRDGIVISSTDQVCPPGSSSTRRERNPLHLPAQGQRRPACNGYSGRLHEALAVHNVRTLWNREKWMLSRSWRPKYMWMPSAFLQNASSAKSN